MQRYIENPVKHLIGAFCRYSWRLSAVIIFPKRWILDVWHGSESASNFGIIPNKNSKFLNLIIFLINCNKCSQHLQGRNKLGENNVFKGSESSQKIKKQNNIFELKKDESFTRSAEKPFKNSKNFFYFISNVLAVLKILIFCYFFISCQFSSCRSWWE